MKILHIETGRNLYGGARQVVWLLEGLADRDVPSVLVCPEGSAIAAHRFRKDVAVEPVPMRGDLDLGFVGRARKLIQTHQPDLVQLHSRRGADWLGAFAARREGAPVVLSRRVTNPETRWLAPLKYKLYDHVVTISAAIAEGLVHAGVDPGKVSIVRSAVKRPKEDGGWDRGRFCREFGTTPDQVIVGMAAQFIARKGHEVLMQAMPDVARVCPDVRVLLFGRGPLEVVIAQRIRELGLEDHVLVPGFREDLDEFIGCFDVLVHPALDEGLGVVLLEASAAGVPVVATNVGGIPEAVKDKASGLLIPPARASALVNALCELAENEKLRRHLGAGGRILMKEKFSLDGMVDGNLAVYKKVIGGQ